MLGSKVEKILKGILDSIPSPSPSVQIQIRGGKVCLRRKGKTLLGIETNFLYSKVCWQRPAMFCLYTLKQTFPPLIWIFTEGEGDGIESRIPFKIFSTLRETNLNFQVQFQILELHFFVFFAISWCGCRNGCPCLSFWHCLRKFRVDIWLRFCGLANFNFWNSVV